jgi:hypothetical protein
VIVVREGSTFGDVAEMISGCEIEFVECAQTEQRVAEEAVVTPQNNVVRFVFQNAERKKWDVDE